MDILKCASLNIGNGLKDFENGYGIYQRLHKLIEAINGIDADIFFLLEANRPAIGADGRKILWEKIVELIQSKTKMTQFVCVKNTKKPNSLGISCLFNKGRIQEIEGFLIPLCEMNQKTIGLKVNVMKNGKIYRMMAVHLPHSFQMKQIALENMISYSKKYKLDFICGDFNTFADSDGPIIIERLKENYKIVLDDRLTYVSFPHSKHYYGRVYKYFHRKKNELFGIIGSSIDQVICNKDNNNVTAHVINPYDYTILERSAETKIFNKIRRKNGPSDRCSDHFPILIECEK